MSIPNPLPPHDLPSEDDPEMDPSDERTEPIDAPVPDRGEIEPGSPSKQPPRHTEGG